MPLKKEGFSVIQKSLVEAIDIDDSQGRSVPINMNFSATGYLSKDTGFTLFGGEQESRIHSIFNYKRKDGTNEILAVRNKKVVKYNESGDNWVDTTKTLTSDNAMTWLVDGASDILYACNAVDSFFSYNGTTFTNHPSVPKGNIMEIYERRLYIAGVTAEPRSLYYSDTGALTTFDATSVVKPLGVDKITALENYYGFLLIFKESSIWKLTFYFDTVTGTWLDKLELQSGNYGAASIRSVVWVENDLWFFTGNREVRAFGFKDQQTGILGMNEAVISEPIKETLSLLPEESLNKASCYYYNRRFYLSVPLNHGSGEKNDTLFVCHNLYGNSWTKYVGREKSSTDQVYSIGRNVYSVKNVEPYAILKWDDDLLNDNGTAIHSSVTFKKVEDKDFNLYNIYRYLDLMFKNLMGKIKVTIFQDKSDFRFKKEKVFFIGLLPEDELGSLGETPFGQALWGDSFGEDGAVSPFIKRRVSFLAKAQSITIRLENDGLEDGFTIAQFAVYGTKQGKRTFSPGGIVSTK